MPNQKEITAMCHKGTRDRYIYFVKKVADNECVWALDANGQAMSQDGHGSRFIMLWSAREYAELCAVDAWAGYQPKRLALDELLGELLPRLQQEGIRIGVFMVPASTDTAIVNAEDLIIDLEQECEKYN